MVIPGMAVVLSQYDHVQADTDVSHDVERGYDFPVSDGCQSGNDQGDSVGHADGQNGKCWRFRGVFDVCVPASRPGFLDPFAGIRTCKRYRFPYRSVGRSVR